MRRVPAATWLAGMALTLAACGAAGTLSGTDPADGQAPAIQVDPRSASLAPAASSAFAAVVTGTAETGVTWSIAEAGGGAVTTAGLYTAPAAAGTYHLVATSTADPTVSARATIVVQAATGGTETLVVVDGSGSRTAISPFVYGFNGEDASDSPPGTTWLRLGGNRWTAYNWETNWSNAGTDWNISSDTHMGDVGNGVAYAAVPAMNYAKANGMGVCPTVPIHGWVAADKAGSVAYTASGYAPSSRFLPNVAAKGSAFSASPSTSDGRVYQDELAWYLASQWTGQATPLHLSLDNEPDLWSQTHPEIQGTTTPTYTEYLTKLVASAKAVKAAAPAAVTLGGVMSGWYGFTTFNGSHEPAGNSTWEFAIKGDFTDWLLAQLSAASATAGKRLLDVLDIHYYSEAQGAGTRVTAMGGTENNTSAAIVAARVQAARSLAAGYVETSWITNPSTGSAGTGGAAIALIPRMLGKIAANYPGTKLAITEWNMGGGNHISGAVAVADALGLFGREGLYAGAYWPLTNYSTEVGARAAWRAFRSYDGAGSSFGAYSVPAVSSDLDHLAVYASTDTASGAPARMVLVLIHRPTLVGGALETTSRTVKVTLPSSLGTARAWQLSGSATPAWATLAAPSVAGGTLTMTLPTMSVTTVELTP